MLNATLIKQARKLASSICEARNLAEEISQDLQHSGGVWKPMNEAHEELSELIAEWADELANIESQADELIQPYDKEIV
jgi:F0F1-type ATP synthase membrane subunit b/b'|tara:strand:- start:93 stop:329 length:237 start_codon:yes stop_codon:yes gene_type:complete